MGKKPKKPRPTENIRSQIKRKIDGIRKEIEKQGGNQFLEERIVFWNNKLTQTK